jgi:EmrB/QacA subfamily drug resistance transporter
MASPRAESRVPTAGASGPAPAASAQPADPALVRRRGPSPHTVLAIASIGASVAFVDATIVNIALPSIAHSFPSAPISSLSWVLNAYNIVFAAFLVAAGRIADILGRRRMFILGLELFTGASVLCAVAPSVGTLIAFRIFQAFGAALLVPASLALVLHAFPREERLHGVALLSAVAAAAAGLGPSLGGLLVAADDWRLVFLVNLPIGLAAIVLARRRLTESRTPGRRRMPDIAGAALFALAIAALVLGVVKGQEWGWDSAAVIGSFAAAAALGGVFAWRCTWHRSPVIDLSLLRIRTFSAANGMTLVGAAGFYGYTLANVLFLTGVWRYSVLQAGLALTPGPFVAAAIARPTSRLMGRIGPRPVLFAGGLIWGAGLVWLITQVGTTPAFVEEWLPGIVILGVGAGTLFPNLSATAVASAPGERFATATALNSVARQVGAAFGVAIVVAVIGRPSPSEAHAAFEHAWMFGAGCMFAAAFGCLLVGRVPLDAAPPDADTSEGSNGARPDGAPDLPRLRARRALQVDSRGPRHHVAESPAEFLERAPLFAGLGRALLESLAQRARAVHVAAGEWLFRAGDPGDVMYVVRTGRLEVVDELSGEVIRELGRGDALGELALLSGAPRSAAVRAARPTDLLAVERADFDELANSSIEMSRALNRVLAEQLRDSRTSATRTRPLPATVALVALDERVPGSELSHGLSAALERHVSAALLDGATARVNGASDPASIYAPLLDRVEAEHDIVVLDAGALREHTPWTQFCLQQADRILAVTAGESPSELAGRHPELRGCDLVAYDVGRGSGRLEPWVADLDPVESHVVRPGDLDADLARMARRLSGNSIAVVLSGGGARAFAHIGVLEELVAAGVTIDRIAGVSMGAFVGGLFAMGYDGDEMDARCFDEWVQRRPLNDYTLPRRSLIRGTRVEAMLRRNFGEVAIEEIERSFMCGCTELRTSRLVIMRSGPLWEQVGLSMCIPVLAPVQVRGRQLFIDGSLTDNLPVGVLADLNEGPIIAVDVKASFDSGAPQSQQEPVERVREARAPGLGETLTRVLLLGSSNTSEAARRHADVVIKPRPDGVGLLEFHQLDVAREAGRSAAREVLEEGLAAGLPLDR